jgi:hypothetical protein
VMPSSISLGLMKFKLVSMRYSILILTMILYFLSFRVRFVVSSLNALREFHPSLSTL